MNASLRRLLVLTGDHELTDATKWGGGYSDSDRALHEAMVAALRSLGRFEVEVCNDHERLFDAVAAGPDLVVNFCDTGYRNEATQELHIPALLEMHGIPYTGAPPSAMVLCYDKPIVSLLARSLGVPVPREHMLGPTALLAEAEVSFPALVKPAHGDGSVGINRGAVVRDMEALTAQVSWFRETLPGRALIIQEYLPGPEYGLALLGNPGRLRPLPPLQVDFSRLPDDVPPILAFESKTGPDNPYDNVGILPAELDAEMLAAMVDRASRLFARLGCRDYARFDFRTGADGTVKLMEVNPNPAWSREAKLAKMAAFAGISYPALLETIVDEAWRRSLAT